MKRPTPILFKLYACEAAVEWSRKFKSVEIAWQYCDVGEWMIWLLTHLGTFDHRPQLKAELERFDEAISPARAVFQKLVDQAFAAYRLIEEPARDEKDAACKAAEVAFERVGKFPAVFDVEPVANPSIVKAYGYYRDDIRKTHAVYTAKEAAADRELKARLAIANKDYAEVIRVILPGVTVERLVKNSKEL